MFLLVFDRYLAIDALVERDERFCASNAIDALNLVVEQLHEMLIVASIHLNEHVIRARAEMAFHHLLYLIQWGRYRFDGWYFPIFGSDRES